MKYLSFLSPPPTLVFLATRLREEHIYQRACSIPYEGALAPRNDCNSPMLSFPGYIGDVPVFSSWGIPVKGEKQKK